MKDVNTQIEEAIKTIESDRGCRVLFTMESGSRAWGFASPDSDYDVRGVYVKPLDWYLQLNTNLPDTIVEEFPGDLDISLWDLRKALVHTAKSNPSFFEWLKSPIVYRDCGLIDVMNTLKAECFDPVHVACHYASMLRKSMEAQNADGSIRIKRLCYALRASVCVKYTMTFQQMPPTLFAETLKKVELSAEEREAIQEVLSRKECALETDTITPDSRLEKLLEDKLESIASSGLSKFDPSAETYARLEQLFRACVKGEMFQE